MSFVKHNDTVAFQQRVIHCLAQKHTVGHVFEHGLLSGHILETDSVSNMLAQFDVHFIRNALRDTHCSNTTWLCARHKAPLANFHPPLRNLHSSEAYHVRRQFSMRQGVAARICSARKSQR